VVKTKTRVLETIKNVALGGTAKNERLPKYHDRGPSRPKNKNHPELGHQSKSQGYGSRFHGQGSARRGNSQKTKPEMTDIQKGSHFKIGNTVSRKMPEQAPKKGDEEGSLIKTRLAERMIGDEKWVAGRRLRCRNGPYLGRVRGRARRKPLLSNSELASKKGRRWKGFLARVQAARKGTSKTPWSKG